MFPHKKLIVYLDQCFISEIVKAKARGDSKDSAIFGLYHALKEGVRADKIVVPSSFFHRVESAGDTRLEQDIIRELSSLGQLEFLPWWDIQNNQFQNQLLVYVKKESRHKKEEWEEAFNTDPDSPLKNFDIIVPGYPFYQIHRELDNVTSDKIQAIKTSTSAKTIEQQHDLELDAIKKEYHKKISNEFKFFLQDNEISEDEAHAFVESKEFEKIRNIHVQSLLWAKELTLQPARKSKSSDNNDIEMLSVILPYSDIVCTDTYMASSVRQLKLDQEYKIEVFSMKEEDIIKCTQRVQEEIAKREPVNIPPFSLLVFGFLKLENLIKIIELLSKELMQYNRAYRARITAFIQMITKIERSDFSKPGMPHVTPHTALAMKVFLNEYMKFVSNEVKNLDEQIAKLPENFHINPIAIIEENRAIGEGLIQDIHLAVEKKLQISQRFKIPIHYFN